MESGTQVHRDYPSGWRNDGKYLVREFGCRSAETFVLTTNSGVTPSSRNLVLIVDYDDVSAILAGYSEQFSQNAASRSFLVGSQRMSSLRARCAKQEINTGASSDLECRNL